MLSWIKQRYHWIIALIMLIELAIVGGILNNYTSLYVIPVTLDLGLSRGEFSLAVSAKSVVSFLLIMFSGGIYLRFGTKKPLFVGLLIMAAAIALLSRSQNLTTFTIGCALVGISEALCATAAVARIIGNWFNRFHGTVLGLVSASTGYGGSIMCILLSNVIQSSGWRTSYMVAAFLILAVALFVLLLIRGRPEDINLSPYGMDYKPEKKKHRQEDDHWEGYTMAELVRKPIFYFTIVILFLSACSIYLSFSMIVPHLQDQGLSVSDAASVNSVFLVLFAIFKFVFGALGDIIGAKKVSILCSVFGAIGLYFLADATSITTAMIGISIYAMAIPVLTILIPLLTYPLFGYRSHSASLGIFMAMASLGSLVAQPIANLVYDKVGSYTPVFYFAAALSLVVAGLFALLFLLCTKARAKYECKTQN